MQVSFKEFNGYKRSRLLLTALYAYIPRSAPTFRVRVYCVIAQWFEDFICTVNPYQLVSWVRIPPSWAALLFFLEKKELSWV